MLLFIVIFTTLFFITQLFPFFVWSKWLKMRFSFWHIGALAIIVQGVHLILLLASRQEVMLGDWLMYYERPYWLWISFALYATLLTLPLALLTLFFITLRRWGEFFFAITFFLTLGLMVYGHYQFNQVKVTQLVHHSEKIHRSYKFVIVSDVQLGSTTVAHSQKIQKIINQLIQTENIDAVLVLGDTIDSDYFEEQFFETLRYGDGNTPVYFVRGNHELYHETADGRLKKYLEDIAKYEFVEQKEIHFGSDLLITGFTDWAFGDSPSELAQQFPILKEGADTFQLVLYHQPKPQAIEQIFEMGADLLFSGHTHAGQVEPIHSIFKRQSPYVSGEYWLKSGEHNMLMYVTSGAGVWGPLLRIGTSNEVVLLQLNSENK